MSEVDSSGELVNQEYTACMGEARQQLSTAERRRGIRLSYVQATLWAAGNGLTSGVLLTYAFYFLDPDRTHLTWLLTAPALFGGLRLIAPQIVRWRGGELRRMAAFSFLLSYLFLLAVPVGCFLVVQVLLDPNYYLAPNSSSASYFYAIFTRNTVTWAWIVLFALHRLGDYIGTVALFAWIGQLVPQRIRGHYFDARQRWQLLVQIVCQLAAAHWSRPTEIGSLPLHIWGIAFRSYLLPLLVGSLVLLASVVPMFWFPDLRLPKASPRKSERKWLGHLASRPLRRLILFSCWVSMANAVTVVAVIDYFRKFLEVPQGIIVTQLTLMCLGQIALSRLLGPLCDRIGNKPVLILCQLITAVGPMFFFYATYQEPHWTFGAYIVWMFYAGTNIAIPNLTLKIAPPGQSASYLAITRAFSDISFAVTGLVIGMAFEMWSQGAWFYVLNRVVEPEQYLFFYGTCLRLIGVVCAWTLVEELPSWWQIWFQPKNQLAEEPPADPLADFFAGTAKESVVGLEEPRES